MLKVPLNNFDEKINTTTTASLLLGMREARWREEDPRRDSTLMAHALVIGVTPKYQPLVHRSW